MKTPSFNIDNEYTENNANQTCVHNFFISKKGLGNAKIKLIEYVGYIITDRMATGDDSEYSFYYEKYKKSFYRSLEDELVAWSSNDIEEYITFLNRSDRLLKESTIFLKKKKNGFIKSHQKYLLTKK